MQQNRAQETPETRTNRRILNREQMQQNRAQETPETRTNRRISNWEKMQQNRAQESPETRTNRRILNREKMQQNRTQETRTRTYIIQDGGRLCLHKLCYKKLKKLLPRMRFGRNSTLQGREMFRLSWESY